MVDKEKAKQVKFEETILELFTVADVSGDGNLTYEEFSAVFEDGTVVALLHTLDIGVKDIEALFDMIDNGDGLISYDEFIQGMRHLKGTATSQDAGMILYD